MTRTIKSLSAFALALSLSSITQASYIDFTHSDWTGVQGESSFTLGDVTLKANNGTMTFNSGRDQGGCFSTDRATVVNLTCSGDGIGLNNDEITGTSGQSLTVLFSSPVDIIEIELLDLFPDEGGTGIHEAAIITIDTGILFSNTSYSYGGYLATGYQANGVTTIVFTANNDSWSDYALARITTSVPEPTSIALLAIGLIGLGAARRRTK